MKTGTRHDFTKWPHETKGLWRLGWCPACRPAVVRWAAKRSR